MRKTISTILVLVMVLSVFTSFGANAEHWAQPTVDFVTQNGYWIAPEPLNPDKVATRAETASLFVRTLNSKIPAYDGAFYDVTADNIYAGDITAAASMNLVVGNDGMFRPNDTLTREELAAILDRASKMVSDEFKDIGYNMLYYRDGEEVSDWAIQSVKNATKYVLMKGKGDKLFDPKGTVTLGEVTTVCKALTEQSAAARVTTTATVRDVTSADNIKDYTVVQSMGLMDYNGFNGCGMMVRFDGAPGDIYVSRKTSSRSSYDSFARALTVAKVTGPDGFEIVAADMFWKDDGTMEKIFSIPDGEPGIYTIEFTCGVENDICTIGVKDPVSWGIFGENAFICTTTTPQKGYIYMPKKHDVLSLGMGGKGGPVSLWNEAGTAKISETAESNGINYPQRVDISGLEGDKVYMIQLPKDYRGGIGWTGAPKIFCPTAEMAWDLKGGIIYYEDEYASLQLSGPLQVRARQRMVEIYEEMGGNFDVNVTKPALKDEYDNIQAEAQLYAVYFHSITNMKITNQKQVLDPTSPWFGFQAPYDMITGKTPFPAKDWQNYCWRLGPTLAENDRVGALTINAETNAYYANPVLQKRVELQYLAWVVTLNETLVKDPYSPAGYGFNSYYHGAETFELGDHGALMHGYNHARNFLSPETRAITDEGIFAYCETGMNCAGQGPSNQMFMGMVAALEAYMCSGKERFKLSYEQRAKGAVYPSKKPNRAGQTSEIGYWQEGGGTDGGSYGRMSEGMWDLMTMYYITLDEELQDPETVKAITDATKRFLEFDSVWYVPVINGFEGLRRPDSYTAREPVPYGGESAIPGNAYLRNLFPRAKMNVYVSINGMNDPETYHTTSSHTAAYIMTNDVAARKHLTGPLWDVYDGTYRPEEPDEYASASSWNMYKALHEPQRFEDSELPILPFALPGDYNIYDPAGGLIAIKHKGMYMTMYYDNGLPVKSNYSYMTSGPVQIWDEYFGLISSSQKPGSAKTLGDSNVSRTHQLNNYWGHFVETEIFHASVVGMTEGGQLFMENNEENKKLMWIEEGKSFEISGTSPDNGYNVIWRYYMTDEGIEIEAGLSSVKEGADLYVQLPIYDVSTSKNNPNATFTFSDEENNVKLSNEGKTVTISWDDSVEAKLDAKKGDDSDFKFLKLKITPEKPMARFKLTRDVGDYVFKLPAYYDVCTVEEIRRDTYETKKVQ